MSLPTIRSPQQLIPGLKIWQQRLSRVVERPRFLRSPFNFRATGSTDGNLLEWTAVSGADGYEILRSDSADFGGSVVTFPVDSGNQESYFDAIGATSIAKYYKIRATSGTRSEPHGSKGRLSAAISATTGSGTTTRDTVSHTTGEGGWNAPNEGKYALL